MLCLQQFCQRIKPKRQAGQVLVEYIILLSLVFLISLVFMKGIHRGLGDVWLFIVKKIAYPTNVDFQ